MPISKKMLDALKRDQKRRARRPAGMQPRELTAPTKLEDRVIRYHQDVLERIEYALITAFRQWRFVDDKVVAAVLRCAILQIEAQDEATWVVSGLLVGTREQLADVGDETWTDCLRVVYTSVRRHSDCQAGATGYLDFVGHYLP